LKQHISQVNQLSSLHCSVKVPLDTLLLVRGRKIQDWEIYKLQRYLQRSNSSCGRHLVVNAR
jgi:hypothetical protein